MFTEEAMFFFYTETPLHAGSGASISYVDLPIQREKHTDYPIVQASGVKGAFRSWADDLYENDPQKKDEIVKAFGPKAGEEHSGALAFTDAQILLFPVRSFAGGFAWITCPAVIHRMFRLLRTAGIDLPKVEGKNVTVNIPEPLAKDQEAYTADPCSLIVDPRIILEDFSFTACTEHSADICALAKWIGNKAIPPADADDTYGYIRRQLPSRLVVLSDEHFRDFVTLATDVQTRISIDGEKGIVDQGPWNEELLLPDTILFSLALGKTVKSKKGNQPYTYTAQEALAFAKGIVKGSGILQLGGDETLGRGIVKVRCLAKGKPLKEEKA